MQYFFLTVVVVFVSLQEVLKKQYSSKVEKPATFFFTFVMTLAAIFFFAAISSFKLDFSPAFLPYSIGFAVSYASALVSSFLAIKYGSLSITLLITSYSLLIPTLYGIFALDEKIGIIGIIGIALLLVSIFLINAKKEKTSFSLKWIICLIIAFISNGMCSLVQKLQQLALGGAYKSEFMIAALMICAVFLCALMLFSHEKITQGLRYSVPLGLIIGVCNGVVNYLVMVLTGSIPNAILFPCISAGGIILGFIASVFIYKEKLSKVQLAGYFIGTLSVVLLNL